MTYDLGANTAVGCIRYGAGGGEGSTLKLQYKKDDANSLFVDATKGNPSNPSSRPSPDLPVTPSVTLTLALTLTVALTQSLP